jgi:hypothetical protein
MATKESLNDAFDKLSTIALSIKEERDRLLKVNAVLLKACKAVDEDEIIKGMSERIRVYAKNQRRVNPLILIQVAISIAEGEKSQ